MLIALSIVAWLLFAVAFLAGPRAAGWTVVILGWMLLSATILALVWSFYGDAAVLSMLRGLGTTLLMGVVQLFFYLFLTCPKFARMVLIGGLLALWMWFPEGLHLLALLLCFFIPGWLVAKWVAAREKRRITAAVGRETHTAMPAVSIARLAAPQATAVSD
jgi:hypothetical protein